MSNTLDKLIKEFRTDTDKGSEVIEVWAPALNEFLDLVKKLRTESAQRIAELESEVKKLKESKLTSAYFNTNGINLCTAIPRDDVFTLLDAIEMMTIKENKIGILKSIQEFKSKHGGGK